MYCSHFGLHRPPFNNTPDPTFYFRTPEHEEALATLQYVVFQRKGFVLITGEVGAGKTLIGRMFLRQVDRNAAVAVISHTSLNGRQLLEAICREFELDTPPDATNLQLTERLQEFLLEQFAQDRHAVVLLDEAQSLPDESFEELRMLGNLEADDAKLLQVCILGQPELQQRLRQPALRQIDQRLFRRFHLPALSRASTEAYILHRLKVAGWTGRDLFTPEAIDRIFAASQGIPRLINRICDNALLTAYGANAAQVTPAMIEQSIEHESLPDADRSADPAAESLTQETPAVAAEAPTPVESAPPPAEMTAEPITAEPMPAEQTVAPAPPPSAHAGAQQAPPLADMMKQQRQFVAAKAARTWRSVRQKMEDQRRDLQDQLDETVRQYQALRMQFRDLASKTASQDELDQLRQAHQAQADKLLAQIARQGQEFKSLLQEAEHRWQETRTRIRTHRFDADAQETLDEVQTEFEEKVGELLGRLDRHRNHIAQLAEVLQGHCTQTQNEIQALREAQAQAEARMANELTRRLTGQEERIAALDAHVGQRITAVHQALGQLEEKALTGQDLEHLRHEQAAAVTDLLQQISRQGEELTTFRAEIAHRLEQQAGRQGEELTTFRTEIANRLDQQAGNQSTLLDEMDRRVAAQAERLEDLRSRLTLYLESMDSRFAELKNHFAARAEVEALAAHQQARFTELRDAHAAHATEVFHRIEDSRQTMHKLIGSVVERFRASQERIDNLAASSAGKDELAALRADHQQETQSLIERLENQKLAMEAQFDRVVWRLQETNNSLETLSAGAARTEDLDQFRRLQAQDQEKVLTLLGAQRRDLETLAEQTGARCQAIAERLDALPADLATTAHIEQVRQEHTGQIRDLLSTLESSRTRLEQSIQQVTDYCDRTSTAVSALAAEAATAGEVQELRDTHDETIGRIEQRIDEQQKLQVNRLHLLTRKVKEHTQRVARIEEQNRTPVRLELAPKAGADLGRVVEAAQQQHTCLTEAVERAGAIAAHLHNASAQVQEALHHWANNADRVQEQSLQLQQAAETAERILTAMRQCHTVMDRKLNSQRWQAELGRGESVARKMEKATTEAVAAAKQLNAVLRDFDRYQELAGDWASRTHSTRQTIENMTGQAQQTVRQLSRLVAEASTVGSKFEQSLNRRKQMLGAVAQNTNRLMELIDAARQADESVSRPGRMPDTHKLDSRTTDSRKADSRLTDARKTDGRKTDTLRTEPANQTTPIDWPSLRVRSPQAVG